MVVEAAVKALLQDKDLPPDSVARLLKRAFGYNVLAYEPETIRHVVGAADVKMPEANFDKLHAYSALVGTGSFFWELNVFENSTLAFNGVVPDMDVLEMCSPAQMAFSVTLADQILDREGAAFPRPVGDIAQLFDYEPLEYCASMLYEAGLVVAPNELSFAQERLNDFFRTDIAKQRRASVKEHLSLIDHDKPSFAGVDPGTAEQLKQLLTVKLYVREKMRRSNELRKLESKRP